MRPPHVPADGGWVNQLKRLQHIFRFLEAGVGHKQSSAHLYNGYCISKRVRGARLAWREI